MAMRIGPFGFWELVVILALVLLLFGPRKLPELAKGLGNAIREFRRGLNDASRELKEEFEQAGEQPQAPRSEELPEEPAEGTHHR